MKDYTDSIVRYLKKEQDILSRIDIEAISRVMNMLEQAREEGKTVFICGNGGSAATASHFVSDFNKGAGMRLEKKYRFVCLNDNTPFLTAVSNDIGYHMIFELALRGCIQAGDILIAISGSGNSENVVRAVRYAKQQGARVIGLTGYDGGQVRELCDESLHAPVHNMQITEDIHLMFNHLMMYILSEEAGK